MACPDESRVRECLWPGDAESDAHPRNAFAVVDLARDPHIHSLVLASAPHFVCVENGRMTREQQEVAPYLVRVQPRGPLLRRWLDDGWGRSWGVLAVPAETLSLERLRRHFEGLLRVRTPDDETVIFRYYDPRVFRAFLPTCTPEQLDEVFGPIAEFWVEAAGGDALFRYRRADRRLERTRVALAGPAEAEWPSELIPSPAGA